MASRYKRINGVNYDRAIVEIAEDATSKSKSSSLSAGDCREMTDLVKKSGTYTKSEKKTLEYVYDQFDFSGNAKAGFRKSIDNLFDVPVKKAAAKKKVKSTSKKVSSKKVRAVKEKKATEPVKKTEQQKDVQILEEKVEENLYSTSLEEPEEPILPPVREEVKEDKSKVVGVVALLATAVIAFIFFFDNIKSFFTTTTPEKKVEQEKTAADKEKVVEKKEPTAVIEKTEKVPSDVDGDVYVIQPGDKLTAISKRFYGNFSDWKIIYKANKDVIKNPALIFPGHKIIIPKK